MSVTTDAAVPALEDLVVYLRPAQRAILQHLADEKAGEVHPVVTEHLQDVVADVGERASVDAATAQLTEWDLIKSHSVPYEGGRARRYQLTERGKELMIEYDGELDDIAKPITEWTPEERRQAPLSTEELFDRLLEDVAALRAQVEESGQGP